jgi:hypothetical protein
MLRPATHTDPNAIPRNGTDVPWVEIPESRPDHGRGRDRDGDEHDAAAGERRRRR